MADPGAPRPLFPPGGPARPPGVTPPRPLFEGGTPGPAAQASAAPSVAPAPALRATPPRPAPPAAPAPAFPGEAATRPPVLDHLTDPEGTTPPKVMAVARALAVALAGKLNDPRHVAAFGEAAQARIAALPDRMLDLVRSEVPEEVTARMGRIRAQVAGLRADDLFAAEEGIAARLLRSLAPARERVENAMRAVELECAGLDVAIPKLRSGLVEVEAMIAEEEAARAELEAHIRAAAAVLAFPAGGTESALRALEDRQTSLRQSRIVAATDAAQLEALRVRHAELVEGARAVSSDLVGLWKRNLVQGLGVLAQGHRAAPRDVRVAATGLRGAAEGVTAAVDALLTSRAPRTDGGAPS